MASKISCTRKLHFCAGHRVMYHEGKCATLHGHNYTVEIVAEAEQLDPLGRVIDFGVLKEKIGAWIDAQWDHTCLISEQDTEVLAALRTLPRRKEPFVCPFNPTAEEIAGYLLHQVCPQLLEGTGVTIREVVVHETNNCSARAFLS